MSTKPRILVVAHGHPKLSPGGGEVVAFEMFQALRATGKAEAFFLGAMLPKFGLPHLGTALLSPNDDPAQTLYWSDQYSFFLAAQENLALFHEDFGRYLKAVNPDVVHFHHIHLLGVEAIRMVKNVCPKAKIVLTLHEYLAICNNNGQMVKTNTNALCRKASPGDCARCFPNIQSGEFFFRERFIKAHYDLVDLFLSPSQFLLERYVDWGIPREKIMYAENGHAGANTPPKFVPPPAQGSFAYFGQVSPFKGLPVLLDAAKYLLSQKFEDFRIDVHGSMLFLSNDQESDMRRRIDEVKSHVRFHGAYRPEDVVGLMAGIDYLVVPSIWWENSPLVIQEAFIARRPVICSNIGGMAEKVRHNVDGLHFRMGDPVALAETMKQACTDKGLLERLIKGIGPVHPMTAMAEEHLALYPLVGTPSLARAMSRHKPPVPAA